MPGTIKLYNSDHEIIEERFYYTWSGVKNIAKVLMEKNPGKGRYIHIAPKVNVTDLALREFGKAVKKDYTNIPVYDYGK